MAYFAQLVNNKVVNVIEGDPKGRFQEGLVWVPCPQDTKIGDYYNLIDDVYTRPTLTLQEEKDLLLVRVKEVYQNIMRMLTGSFPEDERLTWDIQVDEMKDYLADPQAECLFIRALAEARQIPIDTLVKRIKLAYDFFRTHSGYATGKRQLFENMIEGCPDLGHLDVIKDKVNEWERKGLTR